VEDLDGSSFASDYLGGWLDPTIDLGDFSFGQCEMLGWTTPDAEGSTWLI